MSDDKDRSVEVLSLTGLGLLSPSRKNRGFAPDGGLEDRRPVRQKGVNFCKISRQFVVPFGGSAKGTKREYEDSGKRGERWGRGRFTRGAGCGGGGMFVEILAPRSTGGWF